MSEQDRLQGDIDTSSVEFIRQTTRELIDELGFRETSEPEDSPVPPPRRSPPRKVLCVPVRDETDELGAMMLSQLLEAAGNEPVAIPVRRLDEILAAIAAENPDIVFFSGLPPFGIARAHRLYSSVRARYPRVRIMIGIWGYMDDPGKASQKISRGDAVHVSTTLADAVEQVHSLPSMAEPQPPEDSEPSPSNAVLAPVDTRA